MMIKRIKIGMASCGIAAGADEVYKYLQENVDNIDIVKVGCIGYCYAEPLVEVETDEGSFIYENVEPNEEYLDKILNLKDESSLKFRKERTDRELNKVTRL